MAKKRKKTFQDMTPEQFIQYDLVMAQFTMPEINLLNTGQKYRIINFVFDMAFYIK